MAVTLYTSRVILEALGVEDYGIYDVVGGIVTTMAFLNGALGASTSRFLTYELGKGDVIQLKKTFSASLSLHIFVAILVFVLGETIGLWFFYEKMVIPEERMNAALWVYQFSIITTMVAFTQVPYNASIIAHENMAIYAYVGLYEAFSKLAIVYLIFVSPIDKLVFYALLLMLNSCAINFFYRIYTIRYYEECHYHFCFDKRLYKTLLSYSGWDLFGQTALICQGQGINIVLNLFFGPVVNAARALAVQIQMGSMMLVNNFLMAVRPQVVKSYAEKKVERMFMLTFTSAKFAYILMLAVVLPLYFEMDFVLRIWLGDNVPEQTRTFSRIVLITYLMETFHLASLMSYHAIGKIKIGNIVGGTIMILALPSSYIALRMGAPAYSVFIIIFCTNLTQMFWGWMIIHRYIPFSYVQLVKMVYIPTILITILVIIVPIIILSLFEDEGWIRFVLLLFLTETFLLMLTYYIALSKEDRAKVLSIIRARL